MVVARACAQAPHLFSHPRHTTLVLIASVTYYNTPPYIRIYWRRLSERAVRLSASASTAEEHHGVGLATVGLAAADGHAAAARDAREAAECSLAVERPADHAAE